MTRQRGIALIQVLLVTGIIGLLMLQMGLTAREQVARAQALTDRAELQLAAQSRETAMLFSLLTEPWVRKPESQNPYAAAWNFRGDPFTVDDVTWTIQDESGLMQIPRYGTQEFERLLVRLGVEPERARRIGEQLRQRQTGDRASALATQSGARQQASAFPLQAVDELAALPDVGPELYQRLRTLLTLYPTPGFNPLTAPEALLEAMLTESQSAGVLEARRADQLDELTLWKLTGITPEEGTVLASGPGFTVTLSMGLRDTRTRRTTTYILRPYQMEPLAVWQRSKGEDPHEQ
jgi:general secretion pathway protein K